MPSYVSPLEILILFLYPDHEVDRSEAILNAMLPGSQCFNELLAIVPGLSDRLLTERLRELEAEGLVRRSVIPGPPVRVSYEMTEAGKDLEPVIRALGKWAERWVTIKTTIPVDWKALLARPHNRIFRNAI